MDLREFWHGGGVTYGAWLTDPSISHAEMVAGLGFDHVCADAQHGAMDFQALIGVFQAVLLGGSRPLVRARWNEPGILAQYLDAGAHGVIVPLVNSPAEVEAVVHATRYPPIGRRSYGPFMASLRAEDYTARANDRVAVIPMIETVDAVRRIDDMLAVPGIDAIYVGPADLSFSLGLQPRNNDDVEVFDQALATIVTACRNAGVVPGIHSTAALAPRRREQGFRMIGVSTDTAAMRDRMREEIHAARA
jgi:4-hydroxy-2-oxoheptanedioate aldolase